MSPSVSDEDVERCVLALLAQRDATASICPSEVARILAPRGWRALMPKVRTVAANLARAGRLRITQGATEIDPDAVLDGTSKGPLRLRLLTTPLG